MRDRSRSAKLKVLAIARASRNKTEQGRQKMKNAYVKLLDITSRVAGQAKKFSSEIAEGVKQGNLSVMHKAKKQLDEMIPRVQQVMRQTRERVLRGNTQAGCGSNSGHYVKLLREQPPGVGEVLIR